MSVNKVILIGHLGQDPEMRYTANGTPVTNFTMATNERVPVGDNQWEDRTEWHRIVVFGRTAETCAQYLAKGRQIYIEGKIQTRQWEDRDGNRRYTTEIVARDVRFLGSAGGGAGGGGGGGQRNGPPPQDRQSSPRQGGRGGDYGYGGGPQGQRGGSRSEDLPPPQSPPEDDIPF